MTRLNQIIAIEKGVKTTSFQELTESHQLLQKPALLSGISRTYRPKDEEGEQLPPESTKVQVRAEEVIRQTSQTLTRLFDVTATKEWANCRAKGDVVVDGNVLSQRHSCDLSAVSGEAVGRYAHVYQEAPDARQRRNLGV